MENMLLKFVGSTHY